MCIEFRLGFSALEWWKRSNHASFVSRPKGMVNARGWEKCPEVLDVGAVGVVVGQQTRCGCLTVGGQ